MNISNFELVESCYLSVEALLFCAILRGSDSRDSRERSDSLPAGDRRGTSNLQRRAAACSGVQRPLHVAARRVTFKLTQTTIMSRIGIP